MMDRKHSASRSICTPLQRSAINNGSDDIFLHFPTYRFQLQRLSLFNPSSFRPHFLKKLSVCSPGFVQEGSASAFLRLAPSISPTYFYGLTILFLSFFSQTKKIQTLKAFAFLTILLQVPASVDRVSSAGYYWTEFGANCNSFCAASKARSSLNPVSIAIHHPQQVLPNLCNTAS